MISCFLVIFVTLGKIFLLERKESPASWSVRPTQATSCVVKEGGEGEEYICVVSVSCLCCWPECEIRPCYGPIRVR